MGGRSQEGIDLFSVSRVGNAGTPDPCNYQLENLVNFVSLWDAAYHDDIWIFYD